VRLPLTARRAGSVPPWTRSGGLFTSFDVTVAAGCCLTREPGPDVGGLPSATVAGRFAPGKHLAHA
jgi:hypothetical protein